MKYFVFFQEKITNWYISKNINKSSKFISIQMISTRVCPTLILSQLQFLFNWTHFILASWHSKAKKILDSFEIQTRNKCSCFWNSSIVLSHFDRLVRETRWGWAVPSSASKAQVWEIGLKPSTQVFTLFFCVFMLIHFQLTAITSFLMLHIQV